MENDDDSSVIVTTKYSRVSARLIHSIEKNLTILIAAISIVAVFSILDTTEVLSYLYSEEFDSTVDAIFSLVVIGALLLLLRVLLRSRRILDRWADLFERNSITTGMSISMSGRSKEEAIVAIAESVEEIGEPLQKYISSRPNLQEFMDVSISKNVIFDVLIDPKHVSNGHDLKRILDEYGVVVVKIVDGVADENTVNRFISSVLEYVSLTGNSVGLALLIAEEISHDAYNYARKWSNKKINRIILVEKPVYQH